MCINCISLIGSNADVALFIGVFSRCFTACNFNFGIAAVFCTGNNSAYGNGTDSYTKRINIYVAMITSRNINIVACKSYIVNVNFAAAGGAGFANSCVYTNSASRSLIYFKVGAAGNIRANVNFICTDGAAGNIYAHIAVYVKYANTGINSCCTGCAAAKRHVNIIIFSCFGSYGIICFKFAAADVYGNLRTLTTAKLCINVRGIVFDTRCCQRACSTCCQFTSIFPVFTKYFICIVNFFYSIFVCNCLPNVGNGNVCANR